MSAFSGSVDYASDKILVPKSVTKVAESRFGANIDYCNPSLVNIADVSEKRMHLPNPGKKVVTLASAFGLVKDVVGKDLANVSLPVFINEPLTIL